MSSVESACAGANRVPRTIQDWDRKYAESESSWFFGREPSEMARLTANYWKIARGDDPARVMDIGCGEGRDAVHFARRGFVVTAVDGSETALTKAARLAEDAGVQIAELRCEDVRKIAFDPGFDILYAHNCLQFLGRDCLPALHRLQESTPAAGLNSISVFTRESGNVSGDDLYLFDHNELKFEYRGWRLLFYGEEILWREPAGMHLSFARIIAQKTA